jgi:hypothetical protein
MYVGCSGATCIYACCNIGRACICGNIMFLALGFAKETSSLHREMEKGLMCKIAWGEANIAITKILL